MIPRAVAEKVLSYAEKYPVVTITGPRQSGKTTLSKLLFPDKTYVSLENLDDRTYAKEDPRGFLSNHPEGAIFDEIQHVPELLSYIQTIVDDEKRNGMYILTGSRQFEVMDSVTQTLAGRTALVKLLPFSLSEISSVTKSMTLDQLMYTGFYPGIYDQKLDPTEALSFYVSTYVERDVRSLLNIKDLSGFGVFLKLCAGRTGQVLNLSSLGNDCGISHNTAKAWISILEAGYIIKLSRPYYRNFNKRLVKAPKLYFLDPGLASFLMGITSPEQIQTHPLRGALFETFVVTELLKGRFNAGAQDNLYYFRDSNGNEIDVLLDHGISVDLVEIKASRTIVDDFFKSFRYYAGIGGNIGKSFLVYGGDRARKQYGVSVLGWRDFSASIFPP